MGRREGQIKQAASRTGVTVDEWHRRRAAGEQWCYGCRHWLSGDRFAVDRSRENGIARICRPCNSIASTASRYGLTKEQVLVMRGSPCGICGDQSTKINIDHDHITGKVRGPLCPRCNVLIGHCLEDPNILIKAIAYLENHG